MGAKQIVDMARAGNPVFNGCVIRLGQTPLSLLQASVVDYPTYGVTPGTICHSGEPDGVIVATADGALRLDVMANMDGVFSANAFVERFQISAGMTFS
jgi:methionyl-tRNA formyltransferase